jgi:hypothetical protein
MMVGGSVSVTLDPGGNPVFVGSGLALAWARATVNAALAQLPPIPNVGDTSPPYRPEAPVTPADREISLKARRLLIEDKARDANVIGPMLVAYLQANAAVDLDPGRARVDGQSVGRLPDGTPIQPPAAPVLLPLTGTVSLT